MRENLPAQLVSEYPELATVAKDVLATTRLMLSANINYVHAYMQVCVLTIIVLVAICY